MRLGDRVIYQGESYPDLIGEEGILLQSMRGYVGVAFDKEVPEGHNLNGKCEDKHGLYVPVDEVQNIPAFTIGDYVYCVSDDQYGKGGTIASLYRNKDADSFYYNLSEIDGIDFKECNLRKEEDFVKPPFIVGDYVMFREDMHFRIADWAYLASWDGAPLVINGVSFNANENDFEVRVTIEGSRYTTKASNFRPATAEEMDSEYFIQEVKAHNGDIADEWGKGILRNAQLTHSSEEMAKKLFMGLHLMPNESEITSINTAEYLNNVKFGYREWTVEQADEEETWHKWCKVGLSDVWYFLPLIHGEATKQSFMDSEADFICDVTSDGAVIDVVREGANSDGKIFLYDPFQPDTLFRNLIKHCVIKNDEIRTAMQEKRYGDAIEAFIRCNKLYERELHQAEKLISIMNVMNELRDQEQEHAQEQAQQLQSQIDDLEANLADYYRRKREYELMAVGAKQNNNQTEALQMYLTGLGDSLIRIEYYDNRLVVQAKQPLMFFDEELYDQVDMKQSWLRSGYDEAAVQIVDDIVHHKIEITFEETVEYRFGQRNPIATLQQSSGMECRNVTTGIPNPHHYFYNCWGDNKGPIINAFTNGNYLIGIEQIMGAIRTLNLGDGAVMQRFVRQIEALETNSSNHWNGNPCIKIIGTGEVMSVSEYYTNYVKV